MPDTEAKDVLSREALIQVLCLSGNIELRSKVLAHDAELRRQLASALEAQQKAERERDESDRERLLRLFDQHGAGCDNCGCLVIARGGSRGEHNGVSSNGEGESEILCGFCAGEALNTAMAEAWKRESERDEARAEVQRLSGQVEELGKDKASRMVREFHETYGVPIMPVPSFPSHERCALRESLLEEEWIELREAQAKRDIVEVADALADMLYIIHGTALEYGIPLDSVVSEVHRSNMSKLGADGKPIMREDGKVLKGPNYFKPDVAGVLAAMGASGEGESQ